MVLTMKNFIFPIIFVTFLTACGGGENSSGEVVKTIEPPVATIDLSLGVIADTVDDNTVFQVPVSVDYSGTKNVTHTVTSDSVNLVKTNYFNGELTLDSRDLVDSETKDIQVTYTISDGDVSDTEIFSFTLKNTSRECDPDCDDGSGDDGSGDDGGDPALVFKLNLERQSKMNEASAITLPYTVEYNGTGDIVLDAILDVEDDVAEIEIIENVLSITSKTLKGADPRVINVTFTATVGEEIRTVEQSIKILNNIPDTFTVSIDPLLSLDENSTDLININVEYDGLANVSHLISEDSEYIFAYLEEDSIKVTAQYIPWDDERTVTLTLTSKAGTQTVVNTFDVVINNTIPDTVSLEYQNIEVTNENSIISLPFITDYKGDGKVSYGIVSSNTNLVNVSIRDGVITLTSNNITSDHLDTHVVITVTAIADDIVFTESFLVNVLDLESDTEISLSTSGLITLDESSSKSIAVNTTYTGTGTVSYKAYLNNNNNTTVSLSGGVLTITSDRLTGIDDQELVAYISATDGEITDLLEIPFTLKNTVGDTLTVDDSAMSDIAESSTLSIPFPVVYDGDKTLTYHAQSNNPLLLVSVSDGVLLIKTSDVPNANDSDVKLTLSASNGDISDSHIFEFKIINNAPDTLEVSLGDDITSKENTLTKVALSASKTIDSPVSYVITSSNEAIVNAYIEDNIVHITTKDKVGRENENVTLSLVATQGSLESSDSLVVTLINNVKDTITLEGINNIELPENSTTLEDVKTTYSGVDALTYSVSVKNDFITASFISGILTVNSNNLSGMTDTNDVITITATDGFIETTKNILVKIINNASDDLSVTLTPPTKMDENTSQIIPVTIDYTGDLMLSTKLDISDSNLASVTFENNNLTIDTHDVVGKLEEALTVTLTFTEGSVSFSKSFSLLVSDTTVISLEANIQAISSMSEGSESRLLIGANYNGYSNLKYALLNNSTSVVSAQLDGNYIVINANSIDGVSEKLASLTLTVTDGTLSVDKTVSFNVQNDTINTINITAINALTVKELTSGTIPFSVSYSDSYTLTKTVSSNTANVDVSISGGNIVWETKDVTSLNNALITLTVTDNSVSSSHFVAMTINDNALSLELDDMTPLNENTTHELPFTQVYSGADNITYIANSSDVAIASVTVDTVNKKLLITTGNVSGSSFEDVSIVLSATDGVLSGTDTVTFSVVNSTPNSLEINAPSTLTLNDGETSSYNTSITYTDSYPLSYSVTSSNSSILSATYDGVLLSLSISDSVGDKNATLTLTVTDGTLTDTQNIAVTIVDDDVIDTISLVGGSNADIAENRSSTQSISVNYSGSGALTYDAVSDNSSALTATFDGSTLSLTSKNVSADTSVNITVSATDGAVSDSKVITVTVKDGVTGTLSFSIAALATLNENTTGTAGLTVNYTGSGTLTKTVSFSNAHASGSVSGSILTVNAATLSGLEVETVTIEVTITDGALSKSESFTLTVNNSSYSATVAKLIAQQGIASGLPSYSESETLLNFLADKGFLDENLDNATYKSMLDSIQATVKAEWSSLQAEAGIITSYAHSGKAEADVELNTLNWELVLDNYTANVKGVLLTLNSNGVNYVDSTNIDTLYSNGTESSLFHYNINLGSFSGATWNFSNGNEFLVDIIPSAAICYTSPL